jgi:hypothetical protein
MNEWNAIEHVDAAILVRTCAVMKRKREVTHSMTKNTSCHTTSACEWEGSMLHQSSPAWHTGVGERSNKSWPDGVFMPCPDKQHGQVVRGEMRSTRRRKTRGVGIPTHQPCGRVVAGRHVHLHASRSRRHAMIASLYLMFEETQTHEVVRVSARHTDGSLLTKGDRVKRCAQ